MKAMKEKDGSADGAPSISERVVEQIREEILSGRLPPGAPLREVPIAESQGVSRRTIREALLALANQRLVVHERNRGATVRILERRDVQDLYEVRRTLELQGARNAPFASARDRSRLQNAYAWLCEAAHGSDSREMVRSDLVFHGAVVGLSGSVRLQAFYDQVSPEMEMALSLIRGGEADSGWSAEQIIGDHKTIHDSLIAREVMEALRVLQSHIDFNERYLLSLIETGLSTS